LGSVVVVVVGVPGLVVVVVVELDVVVEPVGLVVVVPGRGRVVVVTSGAVVVVTGGSVVVVVVVVGGGAGIVKGAEAVTKTCTMVSHTTVTGYVFGGSFGADTLSDPLMPVTGVPLSRIWPGNW